MSHLRHTTRQSAFHSSSPIEILVMDSSEIVLKAAEEMQTSCTRS